MKLSFNWFNLSKEKPIIKKCIACDNKIDIRKTLYCKKCVKNGDDEFNYRRY